MLKQRAVAVSFLLFLLDEAVTVASFFLAYWLRADVVAPLLRRPIYPLESYLFLLWVALPTWGLTFWFLRLYHSHRTQPLAREMGEILRAVVTGALILALVIFVTRSDFVSRSLVALFAAINCLALMAERALVRVAGYAARSRGRNFRNVLVVGFDERAEGFARMIGEHPHWGIRVSGFIDPGGREPRTVEQDRVLGAIADIPRLIRETVVDEVMFVVHPSGLAALEDTFLLCEEQGVRTRMVMEYLPRQMAKVSVELVEGLPIMTFTTAPVDLTALAVKRAVDCVLAALLLLLLAPLMALLALVVGFTSPGPVLFRQERVGLNGRRFTLLKFRSMFRDAEERKAALAHLNIMDGPVFKVPDDPRVTPAGRILRRWSLDELPQLWNVLRGEMSFVGPRPPIPEEVALYERWQRRRLSMKPGITGLWQVSGRNTVDFATWMRLDLEYIDRWSLWLDLRILLRTIPAVLRRRGAM